MSEEEAYEFVKGTLKEEKIIQYSPGELEFVKSSEDCINCGLCINHCPVVTAVGVDRFSGPRSIAVELSRTPPEFWSTADKVYLCTGCGTCREVCPKNVNIPEIVNLVRRRIFNQMPELVPKGLVEQAEIVRKHNLAFEPWVDPEEKLDSKMMRLERLKLPFIEDPLESDSELLFYPGCQAEELAQEVREAGKLILKHFNIKYTMLDELSCCSLPSRLIGDSEKATELTDTLNKKLRKMGIKTIVTTCAGCTSNLNELTTLHDWGVRVYHLLEFIVEKIGLDRVAEEFKRVAEQQKLTITLHDPCHLIRHTSRQITEYAIGIAGLIPGVQVKVSEAYDNCCGGGGLVVRHAPDVARKIVEENMTAIENTGATMLVTPCPLCSAQIEENLFRKGSDVEVFDLAVFIARHLPLKE